MYQSKRKLPRLTAAQHQMENGTNVSLKALLRVKGEVAVGRRAEQLERDVLHYIVEAFETAEHYSPETGETRSTDNYMVGVEPTPEGLIKCLTRYMPLNKLILRHELKDELRVLEKPHTSKMISHVVRQVVTDTVMQYHETGLWYDSHRGWWCICPSLVDASHARSRTSRRPFKVDRHAVAA